MSEDTLMKAYIGSDRNGDEGTEIVVFAESAGKAKAYVASELGATAKIYEEIFG